MLRGCIALPALLIALILSACLSTAHFTASSAHSSESVMHPQLAFNARPSAATPYGLSPVAIRHAYGLPDHLPTGVHQLVGIVDSGDAVTLEADLQVYDAEYGLPVCTTTNGCLTILNEHGTTEPLPEPDPSWGVETALDVEATHGICPDCQILLVEADSPTDADLTAAVDTAHRMGANEISLSWGGPQSQGEPYRRYEISGVAVTVASGDDGYGGEWPASIPDVIAVGGTHLTINPDGSYGGESVWDGTGSGCAVFAHVQPWQTARPFYQRTGCDSYRAMNDVAADADPNTGLSVYDSTPDEEGGKTYVDWYEVGGTSLSAPLWAATIALSGGIPAGEQAAQVLYGPTWHYHDILSGKNGQCLPFPRLCTAHRGWDGPTGRGSMRGVPSPAS